MLSIVSILLGVLLALTLTNAFVSGEVQMKWGSYRREDNPYIYWFSMVVMLIFTSVFLALAIAKGF